MSLIKRVSILVAFLVLIMPFNVYAFDDNCIGDSLVNRDDCLTKQILINDIEGIAYYKLDSTSSCAYFRFILLDDNIKIADEDNVFIVATIENDTNSYSSVFNSSSPDGNADKKKLVAYCSFNAINKDYGYFECDLALELKSAEDKKKNNTISISYFGGAGNRIELFKNDELILYSPKDEQAKTSSSSTTKAVKPGITKPASSNNATPSTNNVDNQTASTKFVPSNAFVPSVTQDNRIVENNKENKEDRNSTTSGATATTKFEASNGLTNNKSTSAKNATKVQSDTSLFVPSNTSNTSATNGSVVTTQPEVYQPAGRSQIGVGASICIGTVGACLVAYSIFSKKEQPKQD